MKGPMIQTHVPVPVSTRFIWRSTTCHGPVDSGEVVSSDRWSPHNTESTVTSCTVPWHSKAIYGTKCLLLKFAPKFTAISAYTVADPGFPVGGSCTC